MFLGSPYKKNEAQRHVFECEKILHTFFIKMIKIYTKVGKNKNMNELPILRQLATTTAPTLSNCTPLSEKLELKSQLDWLVVGQWLVVRKWVGQVGGKKWVGRSGWEEVGGKKWVGRSGWEEVGGKKWVRRSGWEEVGGGVDRGQWVVEAVDWRTVDEGAVDQGGQWVVGEVGGGGSRCTIILL